MNEKITVHEFLMDVKRQLDENCNSYKNLACLGMMLTLIEDRLWNLDEHNCAQLAGDLKRMIFDKGDN